jgi:hypothetical protein
MAPKIFTEVREPSWDACSVFLIAVFSVLGLLSWNALPRFTDIYYHLLVMSGFQQAGGLVLRDFLQYAPAGRPQLYPPLFPCILLGLFKAGLDPLFIARLVKVIAFPAFLGTLWVVLRSCFGSRQAFFTVLIATGSYSFYSSCIHLIPATLVCILGLLSFRALEKERLISAGFLLGLGFYAQTLTAWIFFAATALYCYFNPLRRRFILPVTLTSFILGLPVTAYQFFNLRYFTFIPAPSYAEIQVSIFIFVIALLGAAVAFKRKGPAYFSLALVAAMSALQIPYYSRYLSGHGLLGFILLGGSALVYLYQKAIGTHAEHWRRLLFILMAFLFFSVINPTVTFMRQMKNMRFEIFNSSAMNLMALQDIYQPRYLAPIREAISARSASDDIIYSNVPELGCYLALVSGRATSNALLAEVKPYASFDPVAAARLIIWFKDAASGRSGEPDGLVSRYGLVKSGETEACYIYLNTASTAKKAVPHALIPVPALFALLLGVIAVPFVERKII